MNTPVNALPTISLNGTKREVLIDHRTAVLARLNASLEAMADATPHPRDYATAAQYEAAVGLHSDRQARMTVLAQEIENEAIMIDKLA